jgi:hypothetical protein
LLRKRNRNSLAARLAGRRQWRLLVDRSKWQCLTGHRQINLTDRRQVSLMDSLQVSLAAHPQGRA